MKIEQILSCLFELQYVAHVAHLQTTSYARHIALNELYTGTIDGLDALAEAWQGEYGIVSGYSTLTSREGTDIVKYITECCSKLETFKKTLSEGYLQQLIDNLLELFYTTKYKLVNLK